MKKKPILNPSHWEGLKIKSTLLTPSLMGRVGVGLLILLLPACRKEGPGGKAVINGTVKHTTAPIAGAVVYIKYGAKESPGSDVTYYDNSVTADSLANYKFADLKRGDYYLFAVGYDSSIVQTVSGAVAVEINSKTETVQADVQVTQ